MFQRYHFRSIYFEKKNLLESIKLPWFYELGTLVFAWARVQHSRMFIFRSWRHIE